jgi:hypothetical protein
LKKLKHRGAVTLEKLTVANNKLGESVCFLGYRP